MTPLTTVIVTITTATSLKHYAVCSRPQTKKGHKEWKLRRTIRPPVDLGFNDEAVMQHGGVVALSVGHRTCDLQVAGSSPTLAPLCNGPGEAKYTCVLLSPSSITWYRSKDGDALRLEGELRSGNALAV